MILAKVEVLNRPGKNLNDDQLVKLHEEILAVAKTCLDEIPDYQCLTGKREEYSRLIISLARDEQGKLIGFCSSYILDGGKLGNILHLGLTCVDPAGRGLGLTHKLTSKVVINFLFRYSLFKKSWISNVACVISSLGNVALYFENVFPSPDHKIPSLDQRDVARLINEKYRHELYINKDATYFEDIGIFSGSVIGTMFEKSEMDSCYYHRDRDLTQFYLNQINFSRGDEVLQIGKVSLLTFPKYLLRNVKKILQRPRFNEKPVFVLGKSID